LPSHDKELTEHQNASEHIINTTLAGLTTQLQHLTQLMTGPAPTLTVTPPPIPTSPPPVSLPSPVQAAPSKQRMRPKLLSPPDFSGEQSFSQAFFNSCMLFLPGGSERVQKGIAHWDKQNNDVPAPNCMLKVQGEIIKVEGL